MTTNTNRRHRHYGRLDDGAPNPIDAHVGKRLRLRRTLMGMSQEQLGAALGLTFQQVQKYERGANRISASRLFDLSRILDVPMQFFFDDMDDDIAATSPAALATGSAPRTESKTAEVDPIHRRKSIELVRNFYAIKDEKLQATIYALVKTSAEASAG